MAFFLPPPLPTANSGCLDDSPPAMKKVGKLIKICYSQVTLRVRYLRYIYTKVSLGVGRRVTVTPATLFPRAPVGTQRALQAGSTLQTERCAWKL